MSNTFLTKSTDVPIKKLKNKGVYKKYWPLKNSELQNGPATDPKYRPTREGRGRELRTRRRGARCFGPFVCGLGSFWGKSDGKPKTKNQEKLFKIALDSLFME